MVRRQRNSEVSVADQESQDKLLMFVQSSSLRGFSVEKVVLTYKFSLLNTSIAEKSPRVYLTTGILIPLWVKTCFEQELGKENNQKQM